MQSFLLHYILLKGILLTVEHFIACDILIMTTASVDTPYFIGILMTIAWGVMVPIGIFIASIMRPAMKKKGLWFQVHCCQ